MFASGSRPIYRPSSITTLDVRACIDTWCLVICAKAGEAASTINATAVASFVITSPVRFACKPYDAGARLQENFNHGKSRCTCNVLNGDEAQGHRSMRRASSQVLS